MNETGGGEKKKERTQEGRRGGGGCRRAHMHKQTRAESRRQAEGECSRVATRKQLDIHKKKKQAFINPTTLVTNVQEIYSEYKSKVFSSRRQNNKCCQRIIYSLLKPSEQRGLKAAAAAAAAAVSFETIVAARLTEILGHILENDAARPLGELGGWKRPVYKEGRATSCNRALGGSEGVNHNMFFYFFFHTLSSSSKFTSDRKLLHPM